VVTVASTCVGRREDARSLQGVYAAALESRDGCPLQQARYIDRTMQHGGPCRSMRGRERRVWARELAAVTCWDSTWQRRGQLCRFRKERNQGETRGGIHLRRKKARRDKAGSVDVGPPRTRVTRRRRRPRGVVSSSWRRVFSYFEGSKKDFFPFIHK
jgi:hypothetical protein